MTAPIDPSRQLAALIRTQLQTLRQRRPALRAKPENEKAQAAGDAAGLAARRIAALPPDDPDRPRKAFRLYLESALLSELGEELANDPEFTAMVDHVQKQFDDDPRLSRVADEAGTLLLRPRA